MAYWVKFVDAPKDKTRAAWVGREVTFPGVDWSNGNKPLVIVAARRDYVAVRHPGGSCWTSIGGDRHIIGVHSMVFRIVGFPEGGGAFQVEEAIDVPVRVPKG